MEALSKSMYCLLIYTLPFNALKTHAMAKNPMPTDAKPYPATSLYLNAPNAINPMPTIIIIKVAQPNTVFLFIPIICCFCASSDASEVRLLAVASRIDLEKASTIAAILCA